MKFDTAAILLLASVAAASAGTAGQIEERGVPYTKIPAICGATPETGIAHHKRFVWVIAEVAHVFFTFLGAGLKFQQRPRPLRA